MSHNVSNNGSFSSNVVQEPFISTAVRLSIQALVIFAAIVGNSIVIRAVRRIYGKRPLGYTLVLNLAVGELGQGLIYPFMLYYEETWNWPYGRFLCKVINPLLIVCLTNITLTVAAIAVYRWRLITAPCTVRSLTPLQTVLIICSFWVIGVLIALPSAVTRNTYHETRIPGDFTGCKEHWYSHNAHITYLCVIYVVVYILPLCIMVISYTMVSCKLRKHMVDTRKRSRQETSSSIITCQTEMESRAALDNNHLIAMNPGRKRTATSDSLERSRRQAGIVEMEQDLLKMIYLIVFSFIVCYIPYQVMYMLNLFGVWRKWTYGAVTSMYVILLITFPSALHPIIYGTKSRFCALAFSWLMKCRWRRPRHLEPIREADNV